MSIKVSIGIAAYNEEKAIFRMLKSMLRQRIPKGYDLVEIIIVSSACTDHTNEIVRSFQKVDPRFILIEEAEKRGKPAAINTILKTFKGDVLVLSGADCVYGKNSLFWLLRDFDDPKTAAVCGRPKPINQKTSLWGYSSHILYDMHHLMSLNFGNKLTGEMCCIRRAYTANVPEDGGDDTFLERAVQLKKGFIKYEPRSVVHILGPQTAIDYFNQRRRVFGHIMKAEQSTKIKSPMTDNKKIIKVLVSNLRSMLDLRMFPVMTVEVFARLMGGWDVKRGKVKGNWESVATTKAF